MASVAHDSLLMRAHDCVRVVRKNRCFIMKAFLFGSVVSFFLLTICLLASAKKGPLVTQKVCLLNLLRSYLLSIIGTKGVF